MSEPASESVESRISRDVAARLRALQALLADPEAEEAADDPDGTKPATRTPGEMPGTGTGCTESR
jgi:hypothetical protein